MLAEVLFPTITREVNTFGVFPLRQCCGLLPHQPPVVSETPCLALLGLAGEVREKEWARVPFIVTSGEVLIQACLWCYLTLPSSACSSSKGLTQAHHSGTCLTLAVKHLHVFTTKPCFCKGKIFGFFIVVTAPNMCWGVLFRIEAALFWMCVESLN